jgi:CCR4-NOT transcriptional regulation complex NOT5 subunit
MSGDSFSDISDDSQREMLLGFVDQIKSGKPVGVITMVMKSRIPGNENLHARVLKAAGASHAVSNSSSNNATQNNSSAVAAIKASAEIKKKEKKLKSKESAATDNSVLPTLSNNITTVSPEASVASISNSSDSTAVAVIKKPKKSKVKEDSSNTNNPNPSTPNNTLKSNDLKSRAEVTDIDALLAPETKKKSKKSSREPESSTKAAAANEEAKKPVVYNTDRMSSIDSLQTENNKISKDEVKIRQAEANKAAKKAAVEGANYNPDEAMFGSDLELEQQKKKDCSIQ